MRKNICILISRRRSGNGNGKKEITENLKSKLGLASKDEKLSFLSLSRVASGKISTLKNSENWRLFFVNVSFFFLELLIYEFS